MVKGKKEDPVLVTVRQESSTNRTLSITLSKSVLEILGFDEIKKGDVLMQWADPTTKIVCLRKVIR
jgi:hypothetical protein